MQELVSFCLSVCLSVDRSQQRCGRSGSHCDQQAQTLRYAVLEARPTEVSGVFWRRWKRSGGRCGRLNLGYCPPPPPMRPTFAKTIWPTHASIRSKGVRVEPSIATRCERREGAMPKYAASRDEKENKKQLTQPSRSERTKIKIIKNKTEKKTKKKRKNTHTHINIVLKKNKRPNGVSKKSATILWSAIHRVVFLICPPRHSLYLCAYCA